MIQPVIKIDAADVLTFFAVAGERAPLAMSVALNRTAEWGTRAGREHARKVMDVRSEQALRFAMPVTLPSKLRATPKALRAIIEPERIGQIYGPFEEGEIHGTDALGRMPAIPSTGFLGLRRTEQTIIPRNLYPVNLGLQPMRDAKSSRIYYALGKGSIKQNKTPFRQTKGGKVQLQGRRGSFQIQGARGPVILQRTGPGQPRALWFLRPTVRRPPILKLYETVNQAVAEHWETEMAASLTWVLGLDR